MSDESVKMICSTLFFCVLVVVLFVDFGGRKR